MYQYDTIVNIDKKLLSILITKKFKVIRGNQKQMNPFIDLWDLGIEKVVWDLNPYISLMFLNKNCHHI